MTKKSWDDEKLIAVVETSRSYRQVIIALGLIPKGGNYSTVKRNIRKLGIDISHFLHMGWRKGAKTSTVKPTPLSQILIENPSWGGTNHSLKNRLIREGIKERKCEICGIISWLDLPISHHMDHINGNREDYRLENLRILCPNCHSQTETYAGRNKNKVPSHASVLE